jgi:signal peptidase I
MKGLRRWVVCLCIGLGVILCLLLLLFISWKNSKTWFGYDIYRVESVSMLPTLKPNDIVIISLQSFDTSPAKISDIVVLQDPNAPHKKLIKRIHAIPGDNTSFIQTTTTLHQDTRLPITARKKIQLENISGYFVLGDNPNHSTDSRDFGVVNKDQLVGLVVYVYNFSD